MKPEEPYRVLVAEDIPEQRDIYRTLLRYHGYHVLEATNGLEAVRVAQEQRPDAIIMDVALPFLDGWAATEQLKADPTTSRIPVLVLTAHAMPFHRERSIAAGADAYLAKPSAPSAVLHEVERLLAAMGPQPDVPHQ